MSWFKKSTKTETKVTADKPAAQGGQPNMDQMVTMLASAPEQQRTTMLADRLAVFASQDEATRERTMKGMLVAALKLPADDYQKIASARFKAVMGLDESTRMTLMKSHAVTVKSLSPEQQQKEMQAMKQIVAGLPEEKAAQVKAMMQNLGLMGNGG